MKLYYFAFPGRAELARAMLHYGNVQFEDFRFPREQWQELKPKMPFHQVPVLEFEDGSMLAMSQAIEKYVARKVGLYPEDSLEIARCDEIYGLITDIFLAFAPTYAIQDLNEKIAKRKEIAGTTMHEKFMFLEKSLGHKDHFVGDKLTYADFGVFSALAGLTNGFMDGLDKSIFADFPNLKAFHAKIASLPTVKAYYEKMHDDVYKAYRPDWFAH